MKGQTATEYLVVLGVVLVTGLILITLLGGVPQLANQKNLEWSLGPVGINNLEVGGKSISGLSLSNNEQSTITIQGIYIGTSINAKTDILNAPVNIRSGETYDFSGASILSESCDLQSNVDFYMSIQYLDARTGAVYNFTADDSIFSARCADIKSCVGRSNVTLGSGIDAVYCDNASLMWSTTLEDTYQWTTDGPTLVGDCLDYADSDAYPACQACYSLERGGYADWRLPDCESEASDDDCEFHVFFQNACEGNSLCPAVEVWDPFFDGSSWEYWTSDQTTELKMAGVYTCVTYSDSGALRNKAGTSTYSVRCVRDGS